MKKNSALGFSLVELLIVISIIGILSAVGLASYITFNQRQTLDQMVRKIVQDLRLAQSLAANNQKPDGSICACSTLDGYTFALDISTKTYTVSANCLPVVDCGIYKSETISSNFTFGGTTSNLKFKVLRRGIDGSGTVTVTAFNRTKTIVIDFGGTIKIQGETP